MGLIPPQVAKGKYFSIHSSGANSAFLSACSMRQYVQAFQTWGRWRICYVVNFKTPELVWVHAKKKKKLDFPATLVTALSGPIHIKIKLACQEDYSCQKS